MLASLDPYTVYYPESRIEEATFMQTGQYGGIGINTKRRNDLVYITDVYDGFGADKAGILIGDAIVKIGDKWIKDLTDDESAMLIKGQPGSTVTLTLKRGKTGLEETLDVKRESVKNKDVPFYGVVPDSKTGYILLEGFTQTAASEVREAFPENIETALFPPNTQLDLVISDCILSYEPRRESCWKLPMWSPVLPYSLVTTLWSPHASLSSWFLFLLSLCPPLERAHKRCSGRISCLLHKFSCPNFLVQPPRSCGWNDTPSIPIICRSTCLFRHFFWSPRARNPISTCQA
jgi:hypothetical protein